MEKEIFDFDDFVDGCHEFLSFSGVTFKKDFGPWKKGDKVESLVIELCDSAFKEYTNEGEVVKSCKFTIQPVS